MPTKLARRIQRGGNASSTLQWARCGRDTGVCVRKRADREKIKNSSPSCKWRFCLSIFPQQSLPVPCQRKALLNFRASTIRWEPSSGVIFFTVNRHSFRATGITNFLENDGTLEAAQRIARVTPDSRTTKLYDRRGQRVFASKIWRGVRY